MATAPHLAGSFDFCQYRRVSKPRSGAEGKRCAPLSLQPLTPSQSGSLAPLFRALGDPVRLRLLSLIASHHDGEVCVCDLSGVFALSGPTISHHLRVLWEADLVTRQRRGSWVYYRAQPAALQRLSDVLLPVTTPTGPVAVPVGA